MLMRVLQEAKAAYTRSNAVESWNHVARNGGRQPESSWCWPCLHRGTIRRCLHRYLSFDRHHQALRRHLRSVGCLSSTTGLWAAIRFWGFSGMLARDNYFSAGFQRISCAQTLGFCSAAICSDLPQFGLFYLWKGDTRGNRELFSKKLPDWAGNWSSIECVRFFTWHHHGWSTIFWRLVGQEWLWRIIGINQSGWLFGM